MASSNLSCCYPVPCTGNPWVRYTGSGSPRKSMAGRHRSAFGSSSRHYLPHGEVLNSSFKTKHPPLGQLSVAPPGLSSFPTSSGRSRLVTKPSSVTAHGKGMTSVVPHRHALYAASAAEGQPSNESREGRTIFELRRVLGQPSFNWVLMNVPAMQFKVRCISDPMIRSLTVVTVQRLQE